MPRRPTLPVALHDAAPAQRLRGAARALAIGSEARTVLADAPRRPTPDDLQFLARSVVRDAARAEFVREGLDTIDLPEGFRRADLIGANLLADREHLAFLDRTLAVIEVHDPAPDAREAARVAHSPTSRDRCGLTLEAASVIASYLIGAAQRLTAEATGPGALRDDQVAEQSRALRDAARETLESLVTAPQELRAAMALRAAVDADPSARPETPEPARPAADPQSGATSNGDAHGTGAPGGAQQTRPSARASSSGTSRTAAGGPSADRWRPSDIRRVLDHADAARAFFETDAGRSTADVLKAGASLLADRAARRGTGSGSARRTDDPVG